MFEQLVQLVKENMGAVNAPVPDNKQEETATVVSHSIIDTLKQAAGTGNVKDLLGMFSGNKTPEATATGQEAKARAAGDLSSKLGLDAAQAEGIAGGLIPNVLKNLVHKTNDPSDSSFNLQDIFSKLTGGKSGGFNVQELMNKYKSGAFDMDGDGDTDLQDVMQMFKGGSGSITDKLKGLF